VNFDDGKWIVVPKLPMGYSIVKSKELDFCNVDRLKIYESVHQGFMELSNVYSEKFYKEIANRF
jgi:hypothetical protein